MIYKSALLFGQAVIQSAVREGGFLLLKTTDYFFVKLISFGTRAGSTCSVR